jgi:hypothetical protein
MSIGARHTWKPSSEIDLEMMGYEVRILREKFCRCSREQFAEMLGLSPHTVRSIECGALISRAVAKKLAALRGQVGRS